MDEREVFVAGLRLTDNVGGEGKFAVANHPPMGGFEVRIGDLSRIYGRAVTRDTARQQKRMTLMRPLRLSVRGAESSRGPAGDEAAIDVTMLDFSRMGIGFVSPRAMEPRDRFTLTLRSNLGALTLFYGVRRAIAGHSSQWRVGGELLGTLGSVRATRAEGVVWALMRGTCAGCGN